MDLDRKRQLVSTLPGERLGRLDRLPAPPRPRAPRLDESAPTPRRQGLADWFV